jgi:ribosomal protein S15P/S13E
MPDNIEHLMLEQFRLIRDRLDIISVQITELYREMHAFRHHVRGNELDIDANKNLLAHLTGRVDRIERRLELSDDPQSAGLADPGSPYDPRPPKRD